MEEKANKFLEEEKLGTLIRKYSVPCIISLLVAALYNIVDQIFIANASYLGSYGNAANNAVFPLTIVALSLAVMIGDGCCAYVSILLGRNEKEDAHKSIGCAIVMVIVVSLILTVLYAVFQNPILTFFGARVNEGTFSNAKEYFTFITMGIPFYMFGQCLNPIIRSDGSPRFAMASTVCGAIFNIIFDPICIYGLHWGMMGAAVATIGGQILTAILAIWYLFHMKAVKLEKKSFGIFPNLMRSFLPLGITSFLSQISIVASMAAVNNMVVRYGALDPIFGLEEYSQIPLAVLGIVMKFFQVVISISVGLAAGCIPVMGYNVGAKRSDRALKLFQMLLIGELITGFVALLIVELFPTQLIGIFGAANESVYYTEFAVKSFRIYLCLLPLATLNKGTFICMQSLGKAALSSSLSMIREVVFGVGWALILPMFFGLNGVLYSMPVSDLLTTIIAVVMILQIFKMLKAESAATA
ncbi:MAG: MATE family efflux transporter [Clostridiales bacterium]|nr:MATE family efflux transporter [Clostridiales bacterium]